MLVASTILMMPSGLLSSRKLRVTISLAGIRRQRIDAGQVGNGCLRMAADRAILAVHRNTGKIADMLVGTGQLIEQRRFAAVLIAGKRKCQFFIGSRGFGVLANVVVLGFPELTHAGCAAGRWRYLSGGRLWSSLIRRADFDLPRFIQAQGQFIAAQLKLHRIPIGATFCSVTSVCGVSPISSR